MSIMNKLSISELNAIRNYIENYAGENGCETSLRTSVEDILDNWARGKSIYLQRMFGEDKLILEKDVEITKSVQQIIKEFDNSRYDSVLNVFINNLCKVFNEKANQYNWRDDDPVERANYEKYWEMDRVVSFLTSNNCLATNKYDDDDAVIELADGKELKIRRGSKVMRTLAKLADSYGVEGFEEFRLKQSQITNQKKLKGHLCLSIHPLDYMTMSDNNCGWSSCMSWQEGGCYRQGTVEMMNSSCVVVAYLTSKDGMRLTQDFKWNSKKWRELYVVTPEIITNIKAYPYRNDELTGIVVKWLKELAEKAGIGNYTQTPQSFRPFNESLIDELNECIEFNFSTYYMYNDFDTSNTNHQGVFSVNGLDSYVEINYSGDPQCMACGGNIECDGNEGSLVCEDCDPRCYCDSCGDYYPEDEMHYVDGVYLCDYCYEEKVVTDFLGNEHIDYNCYDVTLYSKLYNKIKCINYDYTNIWVYNLSDITDEYNVKIYKNGPYNTDYIAIEDIESEELLEHFGLDMEDKENILKQIKTENEEVENYLKEKTLKAMEALYSIAG